MSTTSPVHGELLGCRDYLHRQLGEARSRIKWLDVATGAAIIAVGAVSYVLCLIALDHWRPLPTWARLGLLTLFGGATAGYLVWAVLLPALRRINLLYAAHAIERTEPATKNSLVNWLEISRQGEEVPPSIMQAIERRAAHDLEAIDLHAAIQSTRLLRASYVLAGVVALFCIHAVTTTKALGTSFQRVLFPLAEIAPPTETTLDPIVRRPDGPTIPAGGSLDVVAYPRGKRPAAVTAYVRFANSTYWENRPMSPPVGEHGGWQLTLHDLQRSFAYRLSANDYVSPTFEVQVVPAPMVTHWQVTYQLPEYTRQPGYTVQGGDIEGLEGSTATVEVDTNVPAGAGSLRVSQGGVSQTAPMEVIPGSANQLRGNIVLSAEGSYQVDFTDLEGRHPLTLPIKSIKVQKDAAPVLTFLEPDRSEVEVPCNGSVLFRLSASDDYGLSDVRFSLHRDAKTPLIERKLGQSGKPLGRSQLLLERVDLAPLGLRPGEVLEYWAQASDNRAPQPLQTDTRRTETRRIRLVDPVSESEQKNAPDPTDQTRRDQQLAKKDSTPTGQTKQSGEGSGGSRQGEAGREEQSSKAGQTEGPKTGQTEDSKTGQGEGSKTGQGEDSKTGQTEGLSQEDQKTLEKLGDLLARREESGQPGEQRQSPQRSEPAGQQPQEPGSQQQPSQSQPGTSGEGAKGEKSQEQRSTDQTPGSGAAKAEVPKEAPSNEAAAGAGQKAAGGQPGDKPATRPNESPDSQRPGAGEPRKGVEPRPDGSEKGIAERKDGTAGKQSQEGQKAEQASKPTENQSGQKAAGPREGQQPSGAKPAPSGAEQGRAPSPDSSGSPSEKTPRPVEASPKPGSPGASESPRQELRDNAGAGKASESSEPAKRDQAQPGKAAAQDAGKESGRTADDVPRPAAQEDPPKPVPSGSRKEGSADSSAGPTGNQDGSASQGESSTSGQSSSGSPSADKGDNSNSSGAQKGRGQTEGAGQSQKGSQTAGTGAGDRQGGTGEKPVEQGQPGSSTSREAVTDPPPTGATGTSEKSDGAGDATARMQKAGEQSGQPGGSEGPALGTGGAGAGQQDKPTVDHLGSRPEVDDRLKAANLILKSLEEQLKDKKVDPDLLKNLGKTEQDLREFADRLREQIQTQEATAPLVGGQRDGFGGSQLQKSVRRGPRTASDDSLRGLLQGRRVAPPPEYRKLFEEYTRSLSQSGVRPESKPPTPPGAP